MTTEPKCTCGEDDCQFCRLCRIENNIRNAKHQMNDLMKQGYGRCPHCRSTDLWNDNLAFGCRSCGKILKGN